MYGLSARFAVHCITGTAKFKIGRQFGQGRELMHKTLRRRAYPRGSGAGLPDIASGGVAETGDVSCGVAGSDEASGASPAEFASGSSSAAVSVKITAGVGRTSGIAVARGFGAGRIGLTILET